MVYLVYNKYSGAYSSKRISSLARAAQNEFSEYTLRETVIYGNSVSADIDPGEIRTGDIIAAAGGDGTVNACLQFIHDNSLQERTVLGVIPFGTGNNMVGSLKLPKSVSGALKVLKNRKTEHISYGVLNGSKVFFNCSIGFTSYVLKNRKTNSIAGYFYDTARLIPSYRTSSVKLNCRNEGINIFAGFFINTKVYMSRFKFLKKNNSGNKMNFFFIESGSILSGLTDAFTAFSGIKKYKMIENEKFEFLLPEGLDIELDGDIYEFSGKDRTVSLMNSSTMRIITNGDI